MDSIRITGVALKVFRPTFMQGAVLLSDQPDIEWHGAAAQGLKHHLGQVALLADRPEVLVSANSADQFSERLNAVADVVQRTNHDLGCTTASDRALFMDQILCPWLRSIL